MAVSVASIKGVRVANYDDSARGYGVSTDDVGLNFNTINGLNKNSFNYHRSRRYRASDE
jgi:hypothetical protein